MVFGKTGDYLNSDIRAYLNNEFYQELARTVGMGNILKHPVNLMAEDGTGKEFCRDYVSVLSTERYRAYRKFLPAMENTCWTATRISADNTDYACCVCCILRVA